MAVKVLIYVTGLGFWYV